MARKRKGPGGGNPGKLKSPNPCRRCRKQSCHRNPEGDLSVWCLTCSEAARIKGLKNYNPEPLTMETLQAVAAELGLD